MRWPLGHWRVRQVANLLNLSTLAGLVVGALGRARFGRGPRGLVLAHGHRLPLPAAAAFTVGDVVLTRHGAGYFDDRPRLLAHEERHSWQYAACLGLPLLPLYGLAAAWSWARTGHPAVDNPFERLAGLSDGGYPERGPGVSLGNRLRPPRRPRAA